jgi:hypothetical protein
MLISIIVWFYIFSLSYIYGIALTDFFRKYFDLNDDASNSISIVLLTGLCGITVLATALSIIIKTGWLALLVVLVIGIFFCWKTWRRQGYILSAKYSSLPWWMLILFSLVFLTTLEIATHAPSNPDTGIYHAQAIRWIETYPAVPGLGNLHSRFAFNSNWLVVNALFSFSFLGIQSLHLLPGFFLMTVMIYFFEGVRNLFKVEITFSNILKVLLIPFTFYTIGSQSSSPGTDFPAELLVWVTFALMLESIERNPKIQKNSLDLKEISVFIFSIFLITIKLSTIPVLLLGGFVFITQVIKNRKDAGKLMLLAFIILAPWFARNLILSGYWIYPVPAIAKLSPNWDWKIPLDNVVQETRGIKAWARIPRADAEQVLAMPLKNWIREWFENLTPNRKLMVLGSLFSPIIFTISAWISLRKKTFLGIFYTFIFSSSYIGVFFWFYTAPDIRFGYGFLLLSILLAGIPLIKSLLELKSFQKIFLFGIVLVLVLYQGVTFYRSIEFHSLSSRLLFPADYGQLPSVPCEIHGYQLWCAKLYDSCWYDPFPCIPPGSASSEVELRGTSLEEGFRPVPKP